MALRRLAAFTIKKGFQRVDHLNTTKVVIMFVGVQTRDINTLGITRNLTLLSVEKKDTKVINLKLDKPEEKPLVVMLSWLMARKRHIHKYAEIYLQNGFDVLNVSISPMQLLWPASGTQLVAKDLLTFLDLNTKYAPLVLHGFSVGGYLWGEALVHIHEDKDRYAHVVDRISGQIWDSAADISEISVGLPVAVFPRNRVMRAGLRRYVTYHLKVCHKSATRHYIRSSQMFHSHVVRVPAQFFLSKTDPIGAEASNTRVKEAWEKLGVQVYWKCWDKSPHVGHFRYHQQEYIEAINTFLDNINIPRLKVTEKVKAKL